MSIPAAKVLAVLLLPMTAQALAAQTPTLRASTSLVTVDVTVTGKGNTLTGREDPLIKGLTCADFQLEESKVQQTLLHCEEHHAEAAPTPQTVEPSLPPNVFSNNSAAPMPPAFDIILIDFLNIDRKYTNALKSHAHDLILHPLPGHRTAVFALLGQKLVLLAGFTDDLRILQAAERKMQQSTVGVIDAQGDSSIGAMADMANLASAGMDGSDAFASSLKFTAMNSRVRSTLAAIDAIAAYAGPLPGRKNILWLTGAFPMPRSSDQDDYTSDLNTFSRNLAVRRIALSPIDVRGVVNHGIDASYNPNGHLKEDAASSAMAASMTAEAEERNTMDTVAAQTGGKAFYGSNDIQGMVNKALDFGSDFYTLTYRPTNPDPDGKFRPFKIETTAKGAHLRYRPGYYAAPPPTPPGKASAASAAAADTPARTARTPDNSDPARLTYAMQRGIPDSTAILFFAAVNRAHAPAQGKDQPYDVDYQINPADLVWTHAADNHTANIKILLTAYNANTAVIGKGEHIVHLKMSEAQYRQALTKGIHIHQTLPLPIKGNSFLRVGVVDLDSGRIGTIEIATSALTQDQPKS